MAVALVGDFSMIGRISVLLLIGLAGCTEYLAYTYQPDLAEQPSNQAKYKVDLRDCQDELAATPSADSPFVPFTLSGYGPTGTAQDANTIGGAQEIVNRCMAAKGYRIKPS
jgi:hypothetical protein